MVSSAPALPPVVRNRPALGLLHRPVNYRFTPHDFRAYEESRSWFLHQPRVARAALLMGGIVWRLAREEMDPEVVLNGHEIEAPWFTPDFRVLHGDGSCDADEYLNSDEVAFILGEYRSSTTTWGQTASPSWWPREKTWKGACFNPGFWTPAAEAWYQQTRQAYLDGSRGPNTASVWVDYLTRFDKDSTAARARVRQSSKEILETAPIERTQRMICEYVLTVFEFIISDLRQTEYYSSSCISRFLYTQRSPPHISSPSFGFIIAHGRLLTCRGRFCRGRGMVPWVGPLEPLFA